MKYKFCSIRINVTKYVVTFAIKGHHLFTFSTRQVGCTTGTKYAESTQHTIDKSR